MSSRGTNERLGTNPQIKPRTAFRMGVENRDHHDYSFWDWWCEGGFRLEIGGFPRNKMSRPLSGLHSQRNNISIWDLRRTAQGYVPRSGPLGSRSSGRGPSQLRR